MTTLYALVTFLVINYQLTIDVKYVYGYKHCLSEQIAVIEKSNGGTIPMCFYIGKIND